MGPYMPNTQGYQYIMARMSLFTLTKGIVECLSATIVFIKLNRFLDVSRQPLVAAWWGGGPAQVGEQCLMLLPAEEPMASVAIFVIPLRMEQPELAIFRFLLHKLHQYINVQKTAKMMHAIISFFVIFIAPPLFSLA
jgi:hypothetical protein